VLLGVEKTLPGELVAAAAMTSAGFVVTLAGGAPWQLAVETWASWLLGFASAIFPVRAIVVEHRQRLSSPAARLVAPLAVAGAAVLFAATHVLDPAIVASAASLFAAGLFISLFPPSMKQMTRAGWMLMVAGAIAAALMVAAVRSLG